MSNIKILSVRQPWAWAILAGHKTCENRTWSTSYRGPLLIHCGRSTGEMREMREQRQQVLKQFSLNEVALSLNWGTKVWDLPYPDELQEMCGCLVGLVYLDGCYTVEEAQSRQLTFAEGPVCWQLSGAVLFKQPVPMKGNTLLFNLPETLRGEVKKQVKRGKWPKEWK